MTLTTIKLLVGAELILFISGLSLAEPNSIGFYLSSADFDAIEDRYLDNGNYLANDHENNLARLKGENLKLRGEVSVLEVLVRLSNLTECNEQAFDLLGSVAMATNYQTLTHRKIDQLATHYARRVAQLCKADLLNDFESLSRSFEEYRWFNASHGLGQLGRQELLPYAIHRPGMAEYFTVEGDSQGPILRHLAKGDERNIYGNILKNANSILHRYEKIQYPNFRPVYDEHLFRPCKEHNDIVGQLVPRAYVTVRLLAGDQLRDEKIWKLFDDFPKEFQSSVFRYYFCKSVLNSDNFTRHLIEKNLIQEDQRKAMLLLEAAGGCYFSNLLKKLVCLNTN